LPPEELFQAAKTCGHAAIAQAALLAATGLLFLMFPRAECFDSIS
jgi:hypothetical protein